MESVQTLSVPSELTGLDVSPADDPVLFWTHQDHRRIVVADWGDLKVLGQRLFKRFIGGRGHWADLQSSLHKLQDPGWPAAAVIGGPVRHVLGYVRPWTIDGQEIVDGSKPVVIARASRRGFYLISPVLVPSVEHGRELLRQLRDEQGISPQDWRCYYGEFPPDPMEKLFMPGSPGVRTELEHELTMTFGPKGRARQAFTRPDVALAG